MAGRPRKPTALKVIQGNPGKRALPKNEPKPRPIAPDCPAYLGETGQKKWEDLASRLEDIGVLTEIDGDMLGLYCHAFARFIEAEENLSRHGMTTHNAAGTEVLSPWVTERNQAIADMKKFGTELGIGAASRSRIEVLKPNDETKDTASEILAVTARR